MHCTSAKQSQPYQPLISKFSSFWKIDKMADDFKEARKKAQQARQRAEDAKKSYKEALSETNKTLEDWRVLVKKN